MVRITIEVGDSDASELDRLRNAADDLGHAAWTPAAEESASAEYPRRVVLVFKSVTTFAAWADEQKVALDFARTGHRFPRSSIYR